MNIDTFFKHWGITENPFKAEEARDDQVYARIMEGDQPVHPYFEKVYGSPDRPGTAVVFGEKGAGKTAIRLLMERRLQQWNQDNPERKNWVIRYDDLNPLLDRLHRARERLKGAAAKDPLIRLADHQDYLLTLVVTQLVDIVAGQDESEPARKMRRVLRKMSLQQRLDLAQLAALYDQPTKSSGLGRWQKIRSVLGVGSSLGLTGLFWCAVVSLAVAAFGGAAAMNGAGGWQAYAIAGGAAVACVPFAWSWITRGWGASRLARRVDREVRVVDRVPGQLRDKLAQLSLRDLATQPMPVPGDQDSRYDLTARLIRILGEIGYTGLIVLVDRVDEPASIQGDAGKMKELIWPMLHNKFLQQERIGFKFLLPIELGYLVKKEDAAFYQQARLDKQNMIERLEWTGATLYDICGRRLQSCQAAGQTPVKLSDLFAEEVTPHDVVEALDQMHQPRDAFKFLHQVFQEHCQTVPDDTPNFRVPRLILEQVRKRQSQRLQELHRGLGPA